MNALGERFLKHPLKVMKSYLTLNLLAVEKNTQNLKKFDMESPRREFYLSTIIIIQPVGRDLSSSKLFLEAKINTIMNFLVIFFPKSKNILMPATMRIIFPARGQSLILVMR